MPTPTHYEEVSLLSVHPTSGAVADATFEVKAAFGNVDDYSMRTEGVTDTQTLREAELELILTKNGDDLAAIYLRQDAGVQPTQPITGSKTVRPQVQSRPVTVRQPVPLWKRLFSQAVTENGNAAVAHAAHQELRVETFTGYTSSATLLSETETLVKIQVQIFAGRFLVVEGIVELKNVSSAQPRYTLERPVITDSGTLTPVRRTG